MSIYKTCPDCGANLDSGERCDCAERLIGANESEMENKK